DSAATARAARSARCSVRSTRARNRRCRSRCGLFFPDRANDAQFAFDRADGAAEALGDFGVGEAFQFPKGDRLQLRAKAIEEAPAALDYLTGGFRAWFAAQDLLPAARPV